MEELQAKQAQKVDVSGYKHSYSLRNKLGRVLWHLVWLLLFRPSPRICYGWRRFLLRCFGARVGAGACVGQSTKVWAPWNLEMGELSCMGPEVDCYSADRITLGPHSTVSQYSYLCAAGHDISDPHMQLITAPIRIGAGAWVCAGAFVGPGVCIGEGAVAAAWSVIVKDVEPWTVVGGNPAKFIKKRELRHE